MNNFNSKVQHSSHYCITLMRASLLKRMGAMLYDTLILGALLMLTSALWLMLTKGQAIENDHSLFWLYRLSLILTILIFFLFFWWRDGQTVGMRAWCLRIQCYDGKNITLYQGLLRCFGATISLLCFGLGYLWILVNPSKTAWHDYWSKSEVVVTPKIKRYNSKTSPSPDLDH